jgi:hypothetical protein
MRSGQIPPKRPIAVDSQVEVMVSQSESRTSSVGWSAVGGSWLDWHQLNQNSLKRSRKKNPYSRVSLLVSPRFTSSKCLTFHQSTDII